MLCIPVWYAVEAFLMCLLSFTSLPECCAVIGLQGVQLEQRHGSVKFAALLGEMLLLSHGMFVAIAAVAAHYVPEYG